MGAGFALETGMMAPVQVKDKVYALRTESVTADQVKLDLRRQSRVCTVTVTPEDLQEKPVEMSEAEQKKLLAKEAEWAKLFGEPKAFLASETEVELKTVLNTDQKAALAKGAQQVFEQLLTAKPQAKKPSLAERCKLEKLEGFIEHVTSRKCRVEVLIRNFVPAYITRLETATDVLKNQLAVNVFHRKFELPMAPRSDEPGTARLDETWNLAPRAVVRGFVQVHQQWFMVLENARLPKNQEAWPLAGGMYPTNLKVEVHHHRSKWTSFHALVTPEASAVSNPLVGSMLVGFSKFHFLLDGKEVTCTDFLRRLADYSNTLDVRVAGNRAVASASASTATVATAEIGWKSLAHVYCMNLDHRPERWEFMQGQFQRLRLPVERFSAVNGRELDVPELAMNGIIAMEALPRYYLPDEQKLFGTDLTAGAIGCALSHMLIWRDIVRRCAEDGVDPRAPFLVIEDDCQFCPEFSESLLLERLSHVPEDWQIVYLGGQDLLRRQHLYEVGKGVRRLYKGFRETTAYVINDAGAKACLEVSVPLHWQIDTHMNDESLREGLKPPKPGHQDHTMHPRGYFLWPGIVAQQREGFPTDVQKMEHD
eukprot:s40_g11.t1